MKAKGRQRLKFLLPSAINCPAQFLGGFIKQTYCATYLYLLALVTHDM